MDNTTNLRLNFVPALDNANTPTVAVQINAGVVSFVFPVPADKADAFAEQFSRELRAAAKKARRVASGLVVPGEK